MNQSDDFDQENIILESISCRKWKEFNKNQKILFSINLLAKFFAMLCLLYLFLISLELISISIILLTPVFLKFESIFNHIFSNPVTALFFGILITSLLQNAAATTSIIISMVGTGLISSVKIAIPIIMGSNIGTCVTSSYVALTMSTDSLSLGRAFAAATVNDMFNVLTSLILLPSEIFFNFLSSLTLKIAEQINFEENAILKELNYIRKIQMPIANLFIQIDKNKLNQLNNRSSIALIYCENKDSNFRKECNYLAIPLVKKYGDNVTGLIFLITSTLFLLIIFFSIVKVVNTMIKGPIALWIRDGIDTNISAKFKWLMALILFSIALFFTLIVQSSNIIAATLVPLCGMGVVSINRVYVIIMGSNIGTTITGILSAFSQPGCALKKSLQLAFVYSIFNIFGVIMWLPIAYLQFPKKIALKLGNVACLHRSFIYIYISSFYYIIPLIFVIINLFCYNYRMVIVLIIFLVCFAIFFIYFLTVKYCFLMAPNKLKDYLRFKPGRKINLHNRSSKIFEF